MNKLSIVGRDIRRIDAQDKVTGKAKFSGDFKEGPTLYAKVVRSPYAHARILAIDTSVAEGLPGVKAIVKPEDAPPRRTGYLAAIDRYVLPRDGIVRYAGEGIAIAVATCQIEAEEAAAAVNIEYEELPGIFDAEEAMKKTCPVAVHPDKFSYYSESAYGCEICPDIPNVCTTFRICQGDVEKGFSEADLIIENRFTSGRAQHCRLERYTVDAWVDSDGTLTVRSARSGIWRCHTWLCQLFDLPASKIRVMSPYVGGGFGSKNTAITEAYALLAAIKSGKRVRLEYSREEEFTSTCQRPHVVISVKDGVRKDGTILARKVKTIIDVGAYAAAVISVSPLTSHAGYMSTYKIPNFESNAFAVYTNNPETSTFRGVESPQGNCAIESQMDCIARKLNIDPVELREKNLVRPGDTNIFGQILDEHIYPKECLKKAAELINWGSRPQEENDGWKRGFGIALGSYTAFPWWPSVAIVKVIRDGTLEVRIGTDEVGQGLMTVAAQLVAEEFKVSSDKVRVVRGDTLITPWDWASIASRSTWYTGNAILLACNDAKRQLFDLAAKKLNVTADEMATSEGKVYYKPTPERALNVSDLFTYVSVADKYGEILGRGRYQAEFTPIEPGTGYSPKFSPSYSYIAYAVEVAVHTKTGEVRVLRVNCAVDVGQPINWKMCEAQIEGGIGMGIGTGLYEEVRLNQGVMLNPNFVTYKIPASTEIPSGSMVKSVSVGLPHPSGPYGAKALGEMTLVPFVASVANAIEDAVGVRVMGAPLTRERVLTALKAARKRGVSL